MSVCTRFAPSPTGHLHIGGVRTALFSWLFAKKHQGEFVLRIEDTDRERSTQESVDAILQGMNWLGLDYSQGPYYQTDRFERYAAVIEQLLQSEQAYRCYCSKERLESVRAEQMANKIKPRYDGHCRHHQSNDDQSPFVIRFKNPQSGEVLIQDLVLGNIRIANDQLDDLIIARSDGTPTYNLTVVVDDWDMGISHVIRGDDHINNTPRQINILQALKAQVPQYAHIPMILGPDGKRLSKRHGATSVMQYRDMGYCPEALLNYLVRLGWSHGDEEIFSLEAMIQHFSLEKVNKSAAAMNPDKLNWLNQHYLKTLPLERVADDLTWQLERQGVTNFADGPALTEVVNIQRERVKTLVEMAEKSLFFYQDFPDYEEKAKKHLKPELLTMLQRLTERLTALSNWQAEAIHDLLTQMTEEFDLKLGKVAQPVRVAVTGGTVSPPLDMTLQLLGPERALKRLRYALDWITNA